MRSKWVWGVWIFCGLSTSALAGNFSFVGNTNNVGTSEAHFRLSGTIEEADIERIKNLLRQNNISRTDDVWKKFVVELNSLGGNYETGLQLAVLFRRLGFATIVRKGDKCFSACALAFLGGTEIPKDPTSVDFDGPIPSQSPDRSLEPGGSLGYHAPFLELPASSYTAENVDQAYSIAVQSISEFILVARHLYVSTDELPKLLKPSRNELFQIDTVDRVRLLGIDYTDRTLQFRNMRGYTASMIYNACINRYYHKQLHSSIEGYGVAASTMREFKEGAALLENGEDKAVFGFRRVKEGTLSRKLAYMPIAKSSDNRRFLWCLFKLDQESPDISYKEAGTIADLFQGLRDNNLSEFLHDSDAVKVGDDLSNVASWTRVMDMMPPDTKLDDVASGIQAYLKEEPLVSP